MAKAITPASASLAIASFSVAGESSAARMAPRLNWAISASEGPRTFSTISAFFSAEAPSGAMAAPAV